MSAEQHIAGDIERRLPVKVKSPNLIYQRGKRHFNRRWVIGLFIAAIIALFMPWTQNIRATGYVTTIDQADRPQDLVSQIPGKIVKWYVKEGDYVNAGDTIVQLGEVKDEYLDTQLVPRTEQQIVQNENKVRFYGDKIGATDQQIATLEQQRELKLNSLANKREQIERKIDAKTMQLQAAKVDLKQTADQLERAKIMLEKEAISKFDYEKRNATYVKANATVVDYQNELDNLKQDLVLNKIDLGNTQQEYGEKIAKAQSDRFSISSNIAETKEKVATLEIKKQNIETRAGYYYLLAPQAGQVIRAMKGGINEIVKEGEMIAEIVPGKISYAVELYIKPMDLPLVDTGRNVRFLFDGFPAIVFSGWPKASTGTFGGKILAVESNRSVNGKYRLLVAEDKSDRPWPPNLKLGTGATGIALLKRVPVWYELWRNINGFPADYYQDEKSESKDSKK